MEPEQAGQVDRVPGIGLDPVTGRLLQLARRDDLAPDPGRGQVSVETEAGRPGLVSQRHGAGQVGQTGADLLIRRTQPGLEQLARDAVDRRSRDRPGVHVKPNTRTLGKHRGLPQLSDRPSRQPLLGNPRIL